YDLGLPAVLPENPISIQIHFPILSMLPDCAGSVPCPEEHLTKMPADQYPVLSSSGSIEQIKNGGQIRPYPNYKDGCHLQIALHGHTYSFSLLLWSVRWKSPLNRLQNNFSEVPVDFAGALNKQKRIARQRNKRRPR